MGRASREEKNTDTIKVSLMIYTIMQYVQCFYFFATFYFPVFQNLRNHSYIALDGKPIVRRKRMSVFPIRNGL